MMLADMGAEVLKIEPPPTGKLAGSGASPKLDEARKLATNFTNRNKKSLTLNLKDPAGQEVLHALAKEYDVLLEGFRPGVMQRLGGDYETLRTINPRPRLLLFERLRPGRPVPEFPGPRPELSLFERCPGPDWTSRGTALHSAEYYCRLCRAPPCTAP